MNRIKTYTHKQKISASMKKYWYNKKPWHMKVKLWFKSIDYDFWGIWLLTVLCVSVFSGSLIFFSNSATQKQEKIIELQKEIKELKNKEIDITKGTLKIYAKNLSTNKDYKEFKADFIRNE